VTAGLVADRLKNAQIQVSTGIGGTGVVGILNGATAGRRVGLRADMDALPITEASVSSLPLRCPAGCTPADMTCIRQSRSALRKCLPRA
jgi:metal-dependent amidase/aminoacylase/carboxypeptidase family protein